MDHFARIGTGHNSVYARVIWRNSRLYVMTRRDGTTVYDAPDEPQPIRARANRYTAAGVTWIASTCPCGMKGTWLAGDADTLVRQAEQRLAAGELTLAGTRDVVDA